MSRSNQGEQAAKAILDATEKIVDENLQNYHQVDEEAALNALRQKRLAELQKQQQLRQQYLSNGHGSYTELSTSHTTADVAKEFFNLTKRSDRIVLHCYQTTTSFRHVFDQHLSKLAPKHLETKFCHLNVNDAPTKTSLQFLVQRLNILVLPCLILIRDRQMVHQLRGFDECGSRQQDCSTANVARALSRYGLIDNHDTNDNDDASEDEDDSDKELPSSTSGWVRARRDDSHEPY